MPLYRHKNKVCHQTGTPYFYSLLADDFKDFCIALDG